MCVTSYDCPQHDFVLDCEVRSFSGGWGCDLFSTFLLGFLRVGLGTILFTFYFSFFRVSLYTFLVLHPWF